MALPAYNTPLFAVQQVSLPFLTPQRAFSNGNKNKKKKGFKKPGEVSDAEASLSGSEAEETFVAPTPQQSQQSHQSEPLSLNRDLFQPFTVGDIKKIQSTPDNKVI